MTLFLGFCLLGRLRWSKPLLWSKSGSPALPKCAQRSRKPKMTPESSPIVKKSSKSQAFSEPGPADCAIRLQQNLDFIILNIKISKFHDFWIFEPVEANIYSFYYTKMLQTNQETIWNRFGKILLLHIWQPCFGICWNMCALTFWILEILQLCNLTT